MADALTALAEKTGRSPDALIAEALRDYFDETTSVTPHSFDMYDDPDLSGADSADWFREKWRPR